MIGYSKTVTSLFRNAGWTMGRHPDGSHAIWEHPEHERAIPIPHRLNDKYLAKRILKEAGLPHRGL